MAPKIYRLNSSGIWEQIKKLYRLNSSGIWEQIKKLYRLSSSGIWELIYSSQNAPIQYDKPTLTGNAKGGTSLTATSGTYDSYLSLQTRIAYSTSDTSFVDSVTGSVSSTYPTSVQTSPYSVTNANASNPSLWYAAVDRVQFSGDSKYYFYYGTAIRSYIEPTVNTPTTTSATTTGFTVSWTAGPASYSSSDILIYKASDDSLVQTITSATSPYVWTGGTSGTAYYVKVKVTSTDTAGTNVTSSKSTPDITVLTPTPNLGSINNLKVWNHDPRTGYTELRLDTVTNATSYNWYATPTTNQATITYASSNGSSVTYTANNTFSAGEIVRITGTGSFDTAGSAIASRTSTTFTINLVAPPTGVSVSGTAYILNFSGNGTHTAVAGSTQTFQVLDSNSSNLSAETTWIFDVTASASGYNPSPRATIFYTTPKIPIRPNSNFTFSSTSNSITVANINGGTTPYGVYLYKYQTLFSDSTPQTLITTSLNTVTFSNLASGTPYDFRLYGTSTGILNGVSNVYLSSTYYTPSGRYLTTAATAAPVAGTHTSFVASVSGNAINFTRVPADIPAQTTYFATALFRWSGSVWQFQYSIFHRIDGSNYGADVGHSTGYGTITQMTGSFTNLTSGYYIVDGRAWNGEYGYSGPYREYWSLTV